MGRGGGLFSSLLFLLLLLGYLLLTLACSDDLTDPGIVVLRLLAAGPFVSPALERLRGKAGAEKSFFGLGSGSTSRKRLGGEPRSMATRRARKLLGCKVGCFP